MERQRIVAHIWMWSLIAIGIVLAFLFLPPQPVFSSEYRKYLDIISVPLFVAFIYYLATAVYFRFKYPLSSTGIKKIITAGVYGRTVHPTCTTIAILGWVVFLFNSNWQILASNIWLTFMVFFWIKLEESTFKGRTKESFEPDEIG